MSSRTASGFGIGARAWGGSVVRGGEDALEALAADGDQLAGVEQVLRGPVDVVLVPPAAAERHVLRMVQIADAQRAAVGELGQDVGDQGLVFAGPVLEAGALRGGAVPVPQRPVRDGDDGGLVGQVLGVAAEAGLGGVVVEEGVERGLGVRAEACQEGEVVGALEDVDGVELEDAHCGDRSGECRGGGGRWARGGEALGGDGDASGFGETQLSRHWDRIGGWVSRAQGMRDRAGAPATFVPRPVQRDEDRLVRGSLERGQR